MVLGIDPSINCTGLCISDDNNTIYILIVSKMTKKMKDFHHNRIRIMQYDKYDIKDLNYEDKEKAKAYNIYNIVSVIDDVINEYNIDKVVMEGVAYNATGTIIELAGLNFAIRNLLIKKGIEFTIATPTTIKKFAVANGGADKDLMIYAWQQLDQEMKNIKDIKIDDLADAYFMCQFGLHPN